MDIDEEKLLGEHEPAPVLVERPGGTSPFLLACDHAGRRMPERLGTLGLPKSELERHIGWDIGIWGTSQRLAAALDAVLIGQLYSRLVIDCNRAPGVPTSVVEISELTEVPGNKGLSPDAIATRVREIFNPYHQRLSLEIDARENAGRTTVLIAMHSFTPVFKGVRRPWHAGVLFNRDPSFSLILKSLLEADPDLVVGENEPYSVSDLTDYTIPVHGEARGLPHVEVEIRQDLIADETGQAAWATRLADLLPRAYELWQAQREGVRTAELAVPS